MVKIKGFVKALGAETKKRIPYIIGVTAAILLFGAVQSYQRTADAARAAKDNSAQTKVLVNQVKNLSVQNNTLTQQVKDLGLQNKALQEDSRNQSFCFVKAFAYYTQTGIPVTLDEIETCNPPKSTPTVTPLPKPLSVAPAQTQPKINQPTTSPNPPQSNSSSGSSGNKPTRPNCTVDVLFIHIGKCKE